VEKGEAVEIAPGRTGAFEITRGGAVLYSKLELHRFPDDDEVRALARGG
jgi:selT/selW/selH-like putative selenoprotein